MRANFDLFEEDSPSKDNSPAHQNGQVTYYLPVPIRDGELSHRSQIPCYIIGPEAEKPDFLSQVGRTISKTRTSLKRSRLIHLFYIIALPLYTILGAIIFQVLDGDYDDQALRDFDSRCKAENDFILEELKANCSNQSVDDCWVQIVQAMKDLDGCFRALAWEPLPTHTMSNFANALIYATSVYTTIGYGNIAADTRSCRLATMLYAVIGIPLFFAFLKDMGQLFSYLFIKAWHYAGRFKNRWCWKRPKIDNRKGSSSDDQHMFRPAQDSVPLDHHHLSLPTTQSSVKSISAQKVREQRKVFVWAVFFFLIYLVGVSGLFCTMENWDFFTSFYFLFTSVALIGFGDIFPKQPTMVLINFAFIVLGIVLFGMCYFILQEEIREKAFQASRRVRNSIFRNKHLSNRQRKRSTSLETADITTRRQEAEKMFREAKWRRKSAPAVKDLEEWSTTV